MIVFRKKIPDHPGRDGMAGLVPVFVARKGQPFVLLPLVVFKKRQKVKGLAAQ